MAKAVVFDLDGTLIDSLPDIADNVNIALEKFGAPKRTIEEIRSFIGNGAKNLIEKSFGGLTEEQLSERLSFYNKLYTASGSPKTHVFDGVGEVLVALKKRGYKIAILTNKPQITTNNVYETYLKQYDFDKVVGQKDGVKIKPDPTVLLEMLAEMGVEKSDAYFVGDGDADVQVALNAGVKSVSVLWGYRDKDYLEKLGAKIFVENTAQLLDILK